MTREQALEIADRLLAPMREQIARELVNASQSAKALEDAPNLKRYLDALDEYNRADQPKAQAWSLGFGAPPHTIVVGNEGGGRDKIRAECADAWKKLTREEQQLFWTLQGY